MNKTVDHLCENFNKDMEEYLIATYQDSDIRELKEMAVCIFDVILKRDNEWREVYKEMLKVNFKSTELLRRETCNDK